MATKDPKQLLDTLLQCFYVTEDSINYGYLDHIGLEVIIGEESAKDLLQYAKENKIKTAFYEEEEEDA